MKRLIWIIIFLFVALYIKAQNGEAIDELFRKYSGKDGIASVFISNKMLGMFGSGESKSQDIDNLVSKLKSIRILTVEDSTLNRTINFYSELKRNTDFSAYEEIMSVNEADNVTKFLVRHSGKTIDELLIISGGSKDNSLISIRGDLDLKSISGLSRNLGIQQLEGLEKLDQKPGKK